MITGNICNRRTYLFASIAITILIAIGVFMHAKKTNTQPHFLEIAGLLALVSLSAFIYFKPCNCSSNCSCTAGSCEMGSGVPSKVGSDKVPNFLSPSQQTQQTYYPGPATKSSTVKAGFLGPISES